MSSNLSSSSRLPRCADAQPASSNAISTLRTKARLRSSSRKNVSQSVCAAWADRNSASLRMSRSSSTVVGSIPDSGQNQSRLGFGEGFIGDEVHPPAKQPLQQLVKGEKIVVRALGIVELDIDVHITVAAALAPCKRTKHADAPGP